MPILRIWDEESQSYQEIAALVGPQGPSGLPEGGTDGQILTKTTDGAGWADNDGITQDAADERYLKLTGGAMQGDINLGGHKIRSSVGDVNIGNGISGVTIDSSDVIIGDSNFGVFITIDVSGGVTIRGGNSGVFITSGNFNMSINSSGVIIGRGISDVDVTIDSSGAISFYSLPIIQSDSSPTSDNELVPKQYVDDVIEGKAPVDTTATLSTTWTGSAAPYTQAVAISGMTADAKIEVGLASTATAEQYAAAAAAQLMCTAQAAGSITMTAYGEKPTVAIPILVRVVG